MQHGELLARSELFRGLDPPALHQMVDAARAVTLQRNDVVFAQDDPAEELFIVRSGRIAIAQRSVDGRQTMVALMEPEDLFGDMPLFDGRPRSAEARALEPSQLVGVPYAPIRAVLAEQPELLWSVVSMLAGRLRATNAALADSVFLDVPGRTAKRLLELAGPADEFVLPVTQEELAGLVGASRERVNKALAAFLRLGWLEQADRHYRIVDRDQMTRRAT
ncbi:MAG TPA: Crp/Fnr family transcriptional regulator [Acidimicrobiales bacterium]|nr:Crp/Fnr family transcriptional regulator [Acidimicrobiales bacterium]